VEKAVCWWVEQLKSPSITKEMEKRFEKCLKDEIYSRVTNHWFPNNPTKGQAHRSLSLDKKARPDPVIARAAKAAGINNINECFSYVESIVMWIDPNEVAVIVHWEYSAGGQEHIVYRPKSSVAPQRKTTPEKPLVTEEISLSTVQPSKPVIRNTTVRSKGNSPSSSKTISPVVSSSNLNYMNTLSPPRSNSPVSSLQYPSPYTSTGSYSVSAKSFYPSSTRTTPPPLYSNGTTNWQCSTEEQESLQNRQQYSNHLNNNNSFDYWDVKVLLDAIA